MSEDLPSVKADAFTCPHCGVYSEQNWASIMWNRTRESNIRVGYTGRCTSCGEVTVWVDEDIYYPKASTAPQAHEEMPEEIKRDFDEARLVVDDSPRAAAALLRLGIQRLLENHLDAEGGSINDYIGYLVENDHISPRLQKALDAVRITGNNSVHPGRMNMDDNREMAEGLFMLLNEIVDEAIARDKRIDGFYESLPEDDLKGIENRDDE